jgi:hypothetical protein
MLILDFEGYFQYRATTDPDPTDDARGVSGYTFALAGEPDLDGIVHFQPDEAGVHERDFGPAGGPRVGVTVRSAQRDGVDVPELAGAKVAFAGARILEHNGILIREDFFVIDPFRVILTVDGNALLDRVDDLDPNNPGAPPEQVGNQWLERRQPLKFTANSAKVAAATGLPNAQNVTLIANRLRRKASLEALLAGTTDPVQRAALESRIEQLEIVEQWWNLSAGSPGNRPIDRRAHQLALQASGWSIDMNGKVFANALGADESLPWNVSFWFGGFDGDALVAYAKGTWTIPLKGLR